MYVRDVKDFLKEQDKVKVKVLTVDERGKIGLSIKQLQEPKPAAAPASVSSAAPSYRPAPRRAPANDFRRPNRVNAPSFEDKLSKFLKDSDERLTDLKKNTDSKRGGRGGARRAE
ncbi:MAG: binding domain protein [Firmicutes bacterium]|nr:binding domain protein [Bacillota bacterium]